MKIYLNDTTNDDLVEYLVSSNTQNGYWFLKMQYLFANKYKKKKTSALVKMFSIT